MNRQKMTRAERAKQFMPFAALRGYEGLIKEREKIRTEKTEISEEKAQSLSDLIKTINKGDVIKVTFYDNDGYVTIRGAVTALDLTFKTVTVIREKIAFSSISDLEREETAERI